MPHTSKKYRKGETAGTSGNRTTYIIVAVVVAIVVAAAGFYAYSTFKSTATTSTNQTASVSGAADYAVLATSQGTIEIQLFPSVAPKTVANFVSLANSGFYNNLVWHRIVKGFVIQTGDPNTKNGGGNPSTWGQGGSSTTVPLEANSTTVAEGFVNDEGYVGMARAAALNSGSSQFYINLSNSTQNTSLNGQYTVFGKVISGMNSALALGNLPVNSNSQPQTPSQAMLISVTIKSSP